MNMRIVILTACVSTLTLAQSNSAEAAHVGSTEFKNSKSITGIGTQPLIVIAENALPVNRVYLPSINGKQKPKTGNANQGVAVGDINGDGRPDLKKGGTQTEKSKR